MIHTKETPIEENLDQAAIEIFQDAISPSWLLQLIKVTGVALVVLVVLAFAF